MKKYPRTLTLFGFMAMAVILSPHSVLAEDAPVTKTPYVGSLTLKLNKLPKFEDYLTPTEPLKDRAEKIDLNSYIGAEEYETLLSAAVKAEPNFAGYYYVLTDDCGASCHRHWIINLKTGKIIDRLYSEDGILFQTDSRLLILNPPKDWTDLNEENLQPSTVINFITVDEDALATVRQIKAEGLF